MLLKAFRTLITIHMNGVLEKLRWRPAHIFLVHLNHKVKTMNIVTGYIASICLERVITKDGASPYNLNLNLMDIENGRVISYVFKDARCVRFGGLDNMLLAAIAISDVSNMQMENINYKVKDIENDLVELFCSSVEIK